MFVRAATGESFRAFDISVHQIVFAVTFPNLSQPCLPLVVGCELQQLGTRLVIVE
jgi:hypothetical protein